MTEKCCFTCALAAISPEQFLTTTMPTTTSTTLPATTPATVECKQRFSNITCIAILSQPLPCSDVNIIMNCCDFACPPTTVTEAATTSSPGWYITRCWLL